MCEPVQLSKENWEMCGHGEKKGRETRAREGSVENSLTSVHYTGRKTSKCGYRRSIPRRWESSRTSEVESWKVMQHLVIFRCFLNSRILLLKVIFPSTQIYKIGSKEPIVLEPACFVLPISLPQPLSFPPSQLTRCGFCEKQLEM